jgi:DNA-binding cell septation regulator SpoVG
MNTRVEEIRKLDRGSLRAFATVTVACMIRIADIKIIQLEGKEAFIQMPQRSYSMNNGERKYSNVVDLPDDVTREIEKAILWFWNQENSALALKIDPTPATPTLMWEITTSYFTWKSTDRWNASSQSVPEKAVAVAWQRPYIWSWIHPLKNWSEANAAKRRSDDASWWDKKH